MFVKEDVKTGPAAEIKIIPTWAWVVAGIGLVVIPVIFCVAIGSEPNAPPAWARPLLGLLVGLVGACYLLFIGYINRDAKRRGMSPTLWTLVAILIPNALGILLFFVLRQPLRGICPQCANVVEAGFTFCPRCSCKLHPNCAQCRRMIGPNDLFCPHCGVSLRNQAAPASSMPTNLPG